MIWGVRPAPIGMKYVCLYHFVNISWNYSQDVEVPVTKVLAVFEEQKGIPKKKRLKQDLLSVREFVLVLGEQLREV